MQKSNYFAFCDFYCVVYFNGFLKYVVWMVVCFLQIDCLTVCVNPPYLVIISSVHAVASGACPTVQYIKSLSKA